jgi:predicted ribosomally synthesized peptide with nif11-like leader
MELKKYQNLGFHLPYRRKKMNSSELCRFKEDLKADASLQGEVKTCGADPVKIYTLAKVKGYDFTVDELAGYILDLKRRIDDDQLDRVIGGADVHSVFREESIVLGF